MTTYLITIVTLIKETKVDLFKSHLKQSNSLQQTSCILVQDKKEKFILFNFYCAKITLPKTFTRLSDTPMPSL